MNQDHLIALVVISCAVVSAMVSVLLVIGVLMACVSASSIGDSVYESPSYPPDNASPKASAPSSTLPKFIEEAKLLREQLEAENAAALEISDQVAELVADGGIFINGGPLAPHDAEAIVSSANSFVGNVDFIDQREILPSGCEIIALAVALRAEGYDASPVEIVEAHLDMSGSSERSYGGSPWADGGGFPASIIDAGNSWLTEHAPDENARVMDLTGTSFSGVLRLVELGYPILVWTTEDMAEPAFSGAFQSGLEWYFPEHCVIVYGIEGDDVLVSDSLAGLVRRNRLDFERIFESCGNLAGFVLP